MSDTKEIITKEISRVETQELKYVTPSEIAELNDTISSMMKFKNGYWNCTVCKKQMKKKMQMGYHIEFHIDGITHHCNVCGRTYR